MTTTSTAPPTTRLARTIKTAREARDWRQKDLAGAAGLHYSAVSRLEGETRMPSPETLAGVATALGLDVAELDVLAGRLPSGVADLVELGHVEPAAVVAKLAELTSVL